MKIFISHAREDQNWADKLIRQLETFGMRAWDPARDLLPGDNWAIKQGEALQRADVMIVLLPPQSAQSPWMRHDIQTLWAQSISKNASCPYAFDRQGTFLGYSMNFA